MWRGSWAGPQETLSLPAALLPPSDNHRLRKSSWPAQGGARPEARPPRLSGGSGQQLTAAVPVCPGETGGAAGLSSSKLPAQGRRADKWWLCKPLGHSWVDRSPPEIKPQHKGDCPSEIKIAENFPSWAFVFGLSFCALALEKLFFPTLMATAVCIFARPLLLLAVRVVCMDTANTTAAISGHDHHGCP